MLFSFVHFVSPYVCFLYFHPVTISLHVNPHNAVSVYMVVEKYNWYVCDKEVLIAFGQFHLFIKMSIISVLCFQGLRYYIDF